LEDSFLNKQIDLFLRKEPKAREIGRYYASELGMCPRKLFFQYTEPYEIDSETIRIFEVGHVLHDWVEKVFNGLEGIKLLENERSVTLISDKTEAVIAGRIDDLIYVEKDKEKIIIDVKTTKSLHYLAGPKKEHKMQVMVYLKAFGLKKGGILYVQKNDLKTRYFEFEFDNDLVDEIISKVDYVDRSIKSKIAPSKTEETWQCNYCPFRDKCDKVSLEEENKIMEEMENESSTI